MIKLPILEIVVIGIIIIVPIIFIMATTDKDTEKWMAEDKKWMENYKEKAELKLQTFRTESPLTYSEKSKIH